MELDVPILSTTNWFSLSLAVSAVLTSKKILDLHAVVNEI